MCEWVSVCVCFKQLQSIPLHQLKMQFRSPFSCSEEIWFKLLFPPYQNNNNKKFNLFSFRCLLFPTKGNSAAALSHHLIARRKGTSLSVVFDVHTIRNMSPFFSILWTTYRVPLPAVLLYNTDVSAIKTSFLSSGYGLFSRLLFMSPKCHANKTTSTPKRKGNKKR